MSLADRLKQRNLEREVAGKHPLIAMGLDRGTRDAYFRGIVLAAFLDDGKVDESERAYLRRVGLGLDLPDAEVADMISSVGELKTEDEQLALLEEISGLINKSVVLVKLFLSEFSLVWRSHSANNAELEAYRSEISKMMGGEISDAFWKEFDIIFNDQEAASRARRMLDGIGPEAMAYLFPKYVGANKVNIEGDQSCIESVEDRGSNGCGLLALARTELLGMLSRFVAANSGSASEGMLGNDKYSLVLTACGPNINTTTDLIAEIAGVKHYVAYSIAHRGNGSLSTNLTKEEAIYWQDRLSRVGASAQVVKT